MKLPSMTKGSSLGEVNLHKGTLGKIKYDKDNITANYIPQYKKTKKMQKFTTAENMEESEYSLPKFLQKILA
jgi:hypothetical protein